MRMNIILLSFFITLISCKELSEVNLLADSGFQHAKEMLDNKVKSYRTTKNYPPLYKSWIQSWASSRVEYIFDFMTIASIEQNLKKNHFPKEVEQSIKAARFLSTASADSKIKYMTYKTSSEIDDYLGAAMKYNEYIMFGVIHSTVRANLVPVYNQVPYQVCKRKWYCLWICKKCHTEYSYVRRSNTPAEILIIQQALAAKSAEEMVYKINHF